MQDFCQVVAFLQLSPPCQPELMGRGQGWGCAKRFKSIYWLCV